MQNIFPECVLARVPVSLCGGLWLEGVFARRCPTVCNRLREVAMAVPMASSATGVTFGGFTCRAASFRVAGVMKCHSDVFRNVRVFGGSCYNTPPVQRFPSRMSCRFAWHAWHLVTFSRVCKSDDFLFVWQAQKCGTTFARSSAK